MRELRIIEFNPQDYNETMEAIKNAQRIKQDGAVVYLMPCSNLISTECLYALAWNELYFIDLNGARVFEF